MTLVQALSPLPAIIRNLYKNSMTKSRESHENCRPKKVSRTWIILCLNNSVVMGMYAMMRGDLNDTIPGIIVGTYQFSNFLGLVSNLATLLLYDIAIG